MLWATIGDKSGLHNNNKELLGCGDRTQASFLLGLMALLFVTFLIFGQIMNINIDNPHGHYQWICAELETIFFVYLFYCLPVSNAIGFILYFDLSNGIKHS